MYDVGKTTWRRSALWLLFPSVLFLIILFISHSANSHISPVPSPALANRTAPLAEINLSSDLDHDGFPDAAELRSFNDRENFRRWFTNSSLRNSKFPWRNENAPHPF